MPSVMHCKNNVIMEIDPLFKFGSGNDEQLQEACGFLLPWAIVGGETGKESMEENLLNNYAYFAGWNEGKPSATIKDNGTYSYPRDPDLYPYVTLHKGTETLHIYKYGIIAVRADDNQPYKTTRMD